MSADDFRHIKTGQEAGLPGATLWISSDAQPRVSRDEDRPIAGLLPGAGQPALSAGQADKGRRVCRGKGVACRVIGAQADAVQEEGQYPHWLAGRLGAVVIMREQEGVGSSLAPDGCHAHVPGQYLHIVVQYHQLVDDGAHQQRVIAAGQIGSADAAGEERVAAEQDFVFGQVEAEVTRGMTGVYRLCK